MGSMMYWSILVDLHTHPVDNFYLLWCIPSPSVKNCSSKFGEQCRWAEYAVLLFRFAEDHRWDWPWLTTQMKLQLLARLIKRYQEPGGSKFNCGCWGCLSEQHTEILVTWTSSVPLCPSSISIPLSSRMELIIKSYVWFLHAFSYFHLKVWSYTNWDMSVDTHAGFTHRFDRNVHHTGTQDAINFRSFNKLV